MNEDSEEYRNRGNCFFEWLWSPIAWWRNKLALTYQASNGFPWADFFHWRRADDKIKEEEEKKEEGEEEEEEEEEKE